jgi:hypothetical protein
MSQGAESRSAPEASSVGRARAGLLSADAGDRLRVEAGLAGTGYHLESWEAFEQVVRAIAAGPVVAFVDLAHSQADSCIEALAASGNRVVAYGSVVDELAAIRARSLGAADAVSRDRLLRAPGDWLPPMM